MTFPYSVGGHKMTAEEYITYCVGRMAGLEEELAKAMEVVRAAEAFKVSLIGDDYHWCLCCQSEVEMIPAGKMINHKPDCPIIWLRRHGLR